MEREENTELIKEIQNGVKLIGENTYKNFIKSFAFSQTEYGMTTLLECMIYSLFTFDYLLHSKKLSSEFRKKYVLGTLQNFSKGFKKENDNDDLINVIDYRFNCYAEIPGKKGDKWPQAVLETLIMNLKNSKNREQILKTYPFVIQDAMEAFSGVITFMDNQSSNFKKAIDIVNNLFEEKKKGCYIATMVYKDYESNEVKILRKYRDNVLKKTIIGENFIKLYYYFSPKFVKLFKSNKTINKMCKFLLDKIVDKLK